MNGNGTSPDVMAPATTPQGPCEDIPTLIGVQRPVMWCNAAGVLTYLDCYNSFRGPGERPRRALRRRAGDSEPVGGRFGTICRRLHGQMKHSKANTAPSGQVGRPVNKQAGLACRSESSRRGPATTHTSRSWLHCTDPAGFRRRAGGCWSDRRHECCPGLPPHGGSANMCTESRAPCYKRTTTFRIIKLPGTFFASLRYSGRYLGGPGGPQAPVPTGPKSGWMAMWPTTGPNFGVRKAAAEPGAT
jgi:hypothetical protein